MAFDPLEADYNEATLRAIDGDKRAEASIERGPRRTAEHAPKGTARVAGMALAAAALTGTSRVLEDDGDDDTAIEIIAPAHSRDLTQAVEVIFVPRDPRASVAIVRRWLLPSAS